MIQYKYCQKIQDNNEFERNERLLMVMQPSIGVHTGLTAQIFYNGLTSIKKFIEIHLKYVIQSVSQIWAS